jgi:hypothetical protein
METQHANIIPVHIFGQGLALWRFVFKLLKGHLCLQGSRALQYHGEYWTWHPTAQVIGSVDIFLASIKGSL